MGEFFRGWRRKVGVVTLVLSCVFAGLWIRSRVVRDRFSVHTNSELSTHVLSDRSGLTWKTVSVGPEDVGFVTGFYSSEPAYMMLSYRSPDAKWEWRRQCYGFMFGTLVQFQTLDGVHWREDIWIISYRSIVAPLILLSAGLLLSKPKGRPTKPADCDQWQQS
jgi:hypothetical protein